MTTRELLDIEITSVKFGKELAHLILDEQQRLHRQMVGLYDNAKWQELSDRHYDLRKVRIAIMTLTGKMAIEQKRATNDSFTRMIYYHLRISLKLLKTA